MRQTVNRISKVGSVVAKIDSERVIFESQCLLDRFAHEEVGSGSGSDAGKPCGPNKLQVAQNSILGSKILSPLHNAVGFVGYKQLGPSSSKFG
jgi:hypothetical protein